MALSADVRRVVTTIDKNDKASVYIANAKGVGSLSIDRQGRLYGAHRTERPGSTKPDQASIVNAMSSGVWASEI